MRMMHQIRNVVGEFHTTVAKLQCNSLKIIRWNVIKLVLSLHKHLKVWCYAVKRKIIVPSINPEELSGAKFYNDLLLEVTTTLTKRLKFIANSPLISKTVGSYNEIVWKAKARNTHRTHWIWYRKHSKKHNFVNIWMI